MQTWTDDQIKASLRKGGYHRERALEYMFKAWFSALRDEAKRTGLGQEDAEEIAADAIWALMKQILNTQRGEINYLKTYAVKIAKRMAWRKKTAIAYDVIDLDEIKELTGGEPSGGIDKILRWKEVENELEKMGEPCLSILLMRAWGYRTDEIASHTDLAESTVKNKTRPCREELARRIEENLL